MGGLCAQIAGETLAKNLKVETKALSDLSSYEKNWRALLKDEFKSMQFARWVSNSLSDKALANLFSALRRYEEEITEKGDMDFQSGIIKALRSKPRLLLTGMKEIILDIFRR
jgi:flavin-dependent dehydrogenase